MYVLNEDGSIILPKGDTIAFNVALDGREIPEGSVAIFGISSQYKSQLVFSKNFDVIDNVINIALTNAETKKFTVGKYNWDIRIVTDPAHDDDGNIYCDDESDNVISIFSGRGMPSFEVVEVVVNV